MKKICLILLLLVCGTYFAQSSASGTIDENNSSSVVLDTSETFTGTPTLLKDCQSIIVSPYSDISSATGGVQVWFCNQKHPTGTYYWDKKITLGTYTAGDTTTNFTIPVMGIYFKVVYVNSADNQTVFRLNTYLSRTWIPKTNSSGDISTTITGDIVFSASQAFIDSLQLGFISDYSRGATDTVGVTARDTLSREIISAAADSVDGLFRKCWQGDIISDDTLNVSTNSAFPSTNTQVILPNVLTPLPKVNSYSNPNLYLKSRGTGTARYYVRIWGS